MAEVKERVHNRQTYLRHRCRCEVCTAANTEYRRRHRQSQVTPTRRGDVDMRLDATPLIEWLEYTERIDHVERSTVSKWKSRGISLYKADEWCARFGIHPIRIWGWDFYKGCDVNG